MNFYIKTYGCQMNVNDSEKIRSVLENKGMTMEHDESKADVIIINSCAVRQKPQDKIFSYAGRMSKDQIIIVAGCVAQSEKDYILERNSNIDYIIGTHQYYKIDQVVDEIIQTRKPTVKAKLSRQWQELIPDIASRSSNISGFISIMEGCDNFCTYCIVPFTRGREKHRPYENILKEAHLLAANGYREIVLLGQNVNSWKDDRKNMKFHELLDRLAGQVDVKWIRFITSYPGYYDEQMIDVMAKHPKISRNMHFPVQSGSTRVLKKMKRIYTRPQYLGIIEKFKRYVPDITFSSDFIVGYPGETEYDFQLTLSLVEKVQYENIFSFMYSPRKHTPAYNMKDDILLEVKKQRLYRLQELQRDIQFKNNKDLIGRTVEVLVTGRNPRMDGDVIGRTETYRVVNFKSGVNAGQFTNVRVDNVGPYSLRGQEIRLH
ncbi:MAG: tRNA (N6-isopentenyl adenosine(37)-C2)-methylthiotransferase MiaB [bacterium]|nr:tRNA (N6-isopentenyl adenosine(37)-C2)-methylthiotransferase MiaB [bacterium]